MAKELRRNNVPTELVLIDDCEHSFFRPTERLLLYQKIEAFLAANLGGPVSAPAAASSSTH
jgi:dipeptidyl aminopeptidase/acylaminoacyl peptidase